jgi:hypothetical protein
MFFESVQQMKKMLGQVDKWLAAAASHAEAKSFDPNVYLTLRLAPDQFPLAKQVQIACDTAKLGASRLTGKDAPSHPDNETTLPELQKRIHSVTAYLDGFAAEDFKDTATRSVTQPRWEGKTMTGADFFLEHMTPNFYFHASHVYAILRHNGVNIGKRDYLGTLTMKLP